ncbi:MAG: hypoxanthine phosphoribosyltransferase [Halieaceae bacterium]|jgi:uncharacterized protein|nr:hypoxanthine phosphoribosyltransferase [Halieaceae bacterium]
MNKHFIDARQLLEDSFNLGWQVYQSGFKPTCIVGVWRGGTPVGIAVQELLRVMGVKSDHVAIRTASYSGIGKRSRHIEVHGLTYITDRVKGDDTLLIVDDVYDTGLSINQVIAELNNAYQNNSPEIRIATPYYKPGNNKTSREPDYYLHQTEDWLVFPHELEGLTPEEIRNNKPELAAFIDQLESQLQSN